MVVTQKPKKFWIWKTPLPSRYASSYSEKELAEFQLQFAEIIQRKRKIERVIKPLIVVLFLTILPLFVFGHIWLLLGLPLLILLQIFFYPELYCPACNIIHTSGVGCFCPECNGVMKRSIWSGARCSKCGKSPRTYKGGSRNYKIHYCSHCGVKLSDAGV